jgi:predicted secreted hydrolase
VSFTRLPVRGTLTLPEGETFAVSGRAWFDHEFGSSQLADDQAGWDWFSTSLDDGTDLMVYRIRKTDGSADDTSAGTLRRADGTVVHLRHDAFAVEATGAWTSGETGTTYPSGWVLPVLRVDVSLQEVEVVLVVGLEVSHAARVARDLRRVLQARERHGGIARGSR